MKNRQLSVLSGIILMIAVSSFLLFSLWIQPGDSAVKVKHFNHQLFVSHCKGNHTGIQHTEGNVTSNTTKAVCK